MTTPRSRHITRYLLASAFQPSRLDRKKRMQDMLIHAKNHGQLLTLSREYEVRVDSEFELKLQNVK